MNFTKPVAIVLLVFVTAFVTFPHSSADVVSQSKQSIATFVAGLGHN